MELVVSAQLTSQPEERLFKIVVRLGRDIVILKILLSVKGDLLGLDLTILDFNLVSSQDNRNIFAHTRQITVPVRNVFVGNTGSHVEHDDCALSLDVVSIAQSTEFLCGKKVETCQHEKKKATK